MAGSGADAPEAVPEKDTWPRDDPSKFIVMRTDPRKDAWDHACKLWQSERDRCLLVTRRTTIEDFFLNGEVQLWGRTHCTAILIHVHNIVMAQLDSFVQPIIDRYLAAKDDIGLWHLAFKTPQQAFTESDFNQWGERFLKHALWVIRTGFPGQMRDLEDFLREEAQMAEHGSSKDGFTPTTVATTAAPATTAAASQTASVSDAGSTSPPTKAHHTSQTLEEVSDAAQNALPQIPDAVEELPTELEPAAADVPSSEIPLADALNDAPAIQPAEQGQPAQPANRTQSPIKTLTVDRDESAVVPQEAIVAEEHLTDVYIHPHRRAASGEAAGNDESVPTTEAQTLTDTRFNTQENMAPNAGHGLRQPPQGPSQPRRAVDPHRTVSAPHGRRFSPHYTQSPQLGPYAQPAVHHATAFPDMPSGYLQPSPHSSMQQPPQIFMLPGGQIAHVGPAMPNRSHPLPGRSQAVMAPQHFAGQHSYAMVPPSAGVAQHYPYATQQARPNYYPSFTGDDQANYNYDRAQGFQPPTQGLSESIAGTAIQQQTYSRKWTNNSRGQRRDSVNQYSGRGGRGGSGRLYDHTSNAYVMTGPGPSRFYSGPTQEPFPPYVDPAEDRRRHSNSLDSRPDRRFSNSFSTFPERHGGGYGEYYGNRRPSQNNRRGTRGNFPHRGDMSSRGGRRVSGAETNNPHRSIMGNSAIQADYARGRTNAPREPTRHTRTSTESSTHEQETAGTQQQPSPPRPQCGGSGEGVLRQTASGNYEFEFILQPPSSPPAGRGPPLVSPLPSVKTEGDTASNVTTELGAHASRAAEGSHAQGQISAASDDGIIRKATPSNASEEGFTGSSSGYAATEGSQRNEDRGRKKSGNRKNKRKHPKTRGSLLSAEAGIKSEHPTSPSLPVSADPSAAGPYLDPHDPESAHIAENVVPSAPKPEGKIADMDDLRNQQAEDKLLEVKQSKDVGLQSHKPNAQPNFLERSGQAARLDAKSTLEATSNVAAGGSISLGERSTPRKQVPVPVPVAIPLKTVKRSEEVKKTGEIDERKDISATCKTPKSSGGKSEASSETEVANTKPDDIESPSKGLHSGTPKIETPPSKKAGECPTTTSSVASNTEAFMIDASPASNSDVEKSFQTAASHVADEVIADSEDKKEGLILTQGEKMQSTGSERDSITTATANEAKLGKGKARAAETKGGDTSRVTKLKGASAVESLNPFAIAKAQKEQERRSAKAQRKKERKTQGKHKEQRKTSSTNPQTSEMTVGSPHPTPENTTALKLAAPSNDPDTTAEIQPELASIDMMNNTEDTESGHRIVISVPVQKQSHPSDCSQSESTTALDSQQAATDQQGKLTDSIAIGKKNLVAPHGSADANENASSGSMSMEISSDDGSASSVSACGAGKTKSKSKKKKKKQKTSKDQGAGEAGKVAAEPSEATSHFSPIKPDKNPSNTEASPKRDGSPSVLGRLFRRLTNSEIPWSGYKSGSVKGGEDV